MHATSSRGSQQWTETEDDLHDEDAPFSGAGCPELHLQTRRQHFQSNTVLNKTGLQSAATPQGPGKTLTAMQHLFHPQSIRDKVTGRKGWTR